MKTKEQYKVSIKHTLRKYRVGEVASEVIESLAASFFFLATRGHFRLQFQEDEEYGSHSHWHKPLILGKYKVKRIRSYRQPVSIWTEWIAIVTTESDSFEDQTAQYDGLIVRRGGDLNQIAQWLAQIVSQKHDLPDSGLI